MIRIKNIIFVEDHSMNIPIKLVFNWPSGFIEEDYYVKISEMTTTED
jgi:hypothetical protein